MPLTRAQSKAATAAVPAPATDRTDSPGDGAFDKIAIEAAGPSTTTHREHSPAISIVASTSTTPKSARSARSSYNIKARILAAKAEHARRRAEVDAEHERAQAERERAQAERDRAHAERERVLVDLELQAELAAIEAGSTQRSNRSQGSNSQRVEHWLVQSSCNRDNNADVLLDREQFLNVKPQPSPRPVPPTTADGADIERPVPACSEPAPVEPAEPTTQHLLGLGTRNNENYCNCYQNKTIDQNVGTQFNQLANAIAELGKKTAKVCDVSKFDGRVADWFLFRKSYDQSKAHFSPSENVARLGAALSGAAKEAVDVRLVAADDPEQIMKALEVRFAQPEVIILHQLTLVRALPKLTLYENSRDLNMFACRVRNCIDLVRLLQQPEYLASPELSNSIISKLTPLLRSRWADYAAARVGSGKFKLEILSDFLENEACLHTKFGIVMSEPTFVKSQSQPVKTKDKIFPNAVSSYSPSKLKSSDLCKYCHTGTHEISDCKGFKSLCLDDRWQWVMDNKHCRKCLRKGSHQYRNCKNRCEVVGCVANRGHHTLLHKPRSDLPAPSTSTRPDEQTAVVAHNAAPIVSRRQPLLRIIPVTLSGKKGSFNTFALLDDGSSATLLDRSVANALEDEGPREPLRIHCIGGLTKLSDVSFVNIKVRGRYSSDTFEICARSIPNLNLSAQTASFDDVRQYSHLSDLANVLTYDNAQPTCLIGTDNWHLLLSQSIRQGTKHEPAASLTPLGWVLFGFMGSRASSVEFVNHVEVDSDSDNKLDFLVKNYYKLDSIGIEKKLHHSPSDKRAIEILDATTVRLPSGSFQTGLLWRNNISTIPDSKRLALSRFYNLESKMAKDKCYATSYKQNIRGMIDKGYAELCSGPPTGNITWYLPHFGVVHPYKKKLRVVHDAAAKCHGVSLNSMLLSGPDLLQPLLAIVMRFREGRIALTADIREMFPQVKIRPEDRDAQRFFWRDDPQSPLLEYRMSSMIFGATSSPCTALHLKNKNALEYQDTYPKATQSIIENHYMDDYLGSLDSVEEASRLALEIVTIHKAAGFEMRSWVSNHAEALALIPPDLRATDASEVGLGPSSPLHIKVLGLIWLVSNDSLCFLKSIPRFPPTLTKRSALSLLMSVYDPLGLITPLIIKGRILFQKTWKLGLDWDQKLSEGLVLKYKSWHQELQNLSGSAVPRCYSEGKQVIESQLHVFCDASELAYACVAYWRFVLSDGSIKLALIGGKARLAPLKPATVPRLELQAALIAARFATYIVEAHEKKPLRTFLWSDSVTVLKWLRSDACTFKPFVSFRVAEISELTDVQSWRYVPTGLNVADDATRDTKEFSNDSRWFAGPAFLLSPEATWPCEPIPGESPTTNEDKVFPGIVECLIVTSAELPTVSPVVADYRRFSRWIRLLRATARAHQSAQMFRSLLPHSRSFVNSLRCSRMLPLLSIDELNSAERHLFLTVQRDSFSDELQCVNAGRPIYNHSRLKNVSLLVNEDGLLRLSGRTSASDAVESRPIVLNGKHQITRLLIHDYHVRYAHANNELIVNELRQRYYIVGLRPAVKQIASRCQTCRVWKAKPVTPPIGDLPGVRMAYNERPFTYVGLDYFGPLSVTIGRRHAKRWVALFTCLTVRAVHLEIVENLSSDSAIMALRRFIARHGYPSCIYSDNGTAFVGASKIIADVYEFTSTRQIQWKFIPPSAPFMGGSWERLVRNVKTALSATLKERSPREETFHTLLLEAEAIVNSRPLTHVSQDPDAETALTPFTFLIGTSSNDLQTRTFDDSDLSSRAQWRKAQRLADHFWQRFTHEYLPTLVPRRSSPSVSTNLKIGDLVMIVDGTLPRLCWPRGRIVATYPGKDQVVRVVDVSTKGGVLRRPVRKLAPLIVS